MQKENNLLYAIVRKKCHEMTFFERGGTKDVRRFFLGCIFA